MQYAQGTTFLEISKTNLAKIKIPVPEDPKETEKIVKILTDINEAVKIQRQILSEIKIMKKEIANKLFHKGIEHEDFTKINFGSQIIEKIPSKWNVLPLKELTINGSQNGLAISKTDYGKGVPIVGMTKFYASDILSLDDMTEVGISKKLIEKFCLKSFDLLFGRRSMDGNPLGDAGKCVIVPEIDKEVIFESSIIRMSVKEGIDPFYIYYFLQSDFGKKLMIRIIRVVAVAGISGGDLEKLKIPIPKEIEEQEKISKILANMDLLINQERSYKEYLEKIRQGLMQQVLTCKVRVKV